MSKTATIQELPKDDQVLPDFFEQIDLQIKASHLKENFFADYGLCSDIDDYFSRFSPNSVRTVIIKDNTENALMYAYILDLDGEYILMEIGKPQVYKVSHDKIIVEDVECHRMPFVKSRKGLVIAVRNNDYECYVTELWLRDETNAECKLDFPGGSWAEAREFLKRHGLWS